MRRLLILWGMAAAIGLAITPRALGLDLLILPDSFDDRTLVFGDGDPVYISLGDLRSAHTFSVDVHYGSEGAGSPGQNSPWHSETNTSQSLDPARTTPWGFDDETAQNNALGTDHPAPAPLRVTSVPEPSGWAFALLGAIGALMMIGRKPRR